MEFPLLLATDLLSTTNNCFSDGADVAERHSLRLRSDWLLASSLVELFRCVLVLLDQSATDDPMITADL